MTAPATVLDKIFASKRTRVDAKKASLTTKELSQMDEAALELARTGVPFRLSKALQSVDRVNIIAEFKRASPSKGIINDISDPGEKTAEYERAGAAAVSVLTEEDHFLGSLDDLCKVRRSVAIPLLRKDFLFDPMQISESRISGASAVLLIAAMLDDRTIAELMAKAEELGLDSLVEVHDREEFERAKALGARLIGVNNRDLRTFEVSLDRSRELIALKPPDAMMISESGINSRQQIEELRMMGFDGFLIGEALMTGDPCGLFEA